MNLRFRIKPWQKKLLIGLTLFIIGLIGFQFFPTTAFGQSVGASASPDATTFGETGKVIGQILATIVYVIIIWPGKLILGVLMSILYYVAGFNNFIYVTAVNIGWVIVRDVANTFFILGLIVIAFGTILRKQAYNWRALLPRFILSAILVNFSKVIAGIYIDLAQVIMMTFVNATGFSGPAILYSQSGIDQFFNFPSSGASINFLTVLGGIIIGACAMIALIIVVGIFVLVLIMRIVAIWTLVIFSPLPYLLQIFPKFKSQADDWWNQFTQYLVVGPVLAFFLYLTIAILSSTSGSLKNDIKTGAAPGADATTSIDKATAGSDAVVGLNPLNMISFIVVLAIMSQGLLMASKVGGTVGGWAGKASGYVRGLPISATRTGLSALGSAAGYGRDKFTAATGIELRPTKTRLYQSASDLAKRLGRPSEEKMDEAVINRRASAGIEAANLARSDKASLERDKKFNEQNRDKRVETLAGDKLASSYLNAGEKDEALKKYVDSNLAELTGETKENLAAMSDTDRSDLKAMALEDLEADAGKQEKALAQQFREDAATEFDASSMGKLVAGNIRRATKGIEDRDKDIKTASSLRPSDLKRLQELREQDAKGSDIYKTDDGEEAVSYVRSAQKNKDSKAMLLSLLGASKGGKLGDVLSSYGKDNSRKGLQEFVDEVLVDKKKGMGIDKTRAYDIGRRMSQMSGDKDKIYSGAFKARADGSVVRGNAMESSQVHLSQLQSGDKENTVRSSGPSAYMAKGGDGKFRWDTAGLAYVTENFKAFAKQINAERMNLKSAAAMYSNPENISHLKSEGAKKFTDATDKQEFDKFVAALEKYGKKAQDSGTSVSKSLEKAVKSAAETLNKGAARGGRGGGPTPLTP